jgi:hypothetical protein
LLAALSGVAKGMSLEQSVTVPDIGQGIRINKALEAAASCPNVTVPADHLDIVKQACETAGINPPSDQMNDIARAIFDALMRTAKK